MSNNDIDPDNHSGYWERLSGFIACYQRPSTGYSMYDRAPAALSSAGRRESSSTEGSITSPFRTNTRSGFGASHHASTITGSTATRSTETRSIFDKHSRQGGHTDTDSIGQHSHPSMHSHQPTFAQQFTPPPYADTTLLPPMPAVRQLGDPSLWCEFAPVLGCQARYAINEEDDWINHHMMHLNDHLPAQLKCWFCDHVAFPSPQYQLDPISNFHFRMEHIRQHIFDEELRLDNMRPDFLMMDHLETNGILAQPERRRMDGYDELPDRFRIPGTSDNWTAESQAVPERERGVPYDLEREARQHRRTKESRKERK